ncbi:MAG: hypothetical protein EOP90_12320 [Lysobacteraceae bacterium]|nr:MAG: hypothetical protein EOP90_12320 [Xanthomonadaceae bacterium]
MDTIHRAPLSERNARRGCGRGPARHITSGAAGLACSLLAAMLALPATASQATPAAPAPMDIDCAETPFGLSIPFARDIEPIYLSGGAAGQFFDEYRPGTRGNPEPIELVYRAGLLQGSLPNKPFQKGTRVDLDGNGRDEVAVAFSDDNGVFVGVYTRASGFEPTAQLIDAWSYAEGVVADSIDIQAGDFDGSQDGRHELALSWKTAGTTRIVFLRGADDGGILDAPDAPSGNWTAPSGSAASPRMAVGDFLLDGRDQVVLVGTGTSPLALDMDLVEFETPWPGVLTRAGSAGGVGSKRFIDAIGLFPTDTDPAPSPVTRSIDAVPALAVAAGDLVDTAAAELVVAPTILGRNFDIGVWEYFSAIGQRLFHFETTRDVATNDVLGVALGNGGTHDSSRYYEIYAWALTGFQYAPPPPAYAMTIAPLNGGSDPIGNRIIVARAGIENGSIDTPMDTGGLSWWANGAKVRLAAGFAWQTLAPLGGEAPGVRSVQFTSTAHGDIESHTWNIAGSVSHEVNPVRSFTTGSHAVSLTVKEVGGATQTWSTTINVNSGTSGGSYPPFVYAIDASTAAGHGADPAAVYGNSGGVSSRVDIAVGDVDNDGVADVLTAASSLDGRLDRHVWTFRAGSSNTYDFRKISQAFGSAVTDLGMLAPDFDGNSMRAAIGLDCRRVTDQLVRSVTFLPPYWRNLQSEVYMTTTYGQSSSHSSSYESRSGSYTSHDITGYLGATQETNVPILGLKLTEWTIKGSAGHTWQSGRGQLHGNENAYTVNQGFGTQHGEGLVTADTSISDCYSYDVVTSDGPLGQSALRACEVLQGGTTYEATNIERRNSLTDEVRPIQVPPSWTPIQRDWASQALFRPATISNRITLVAGNTGEEANDGLFTSSIASRAAVLEPYVQIDLGEVHDISSIRVFPSESRVKDLWGYRIYASQDPISGDDVPAGAGIRMFRQDTGGTESFYRTWNLYTLDRNDPTQPLRARYIRLQHPGPLPVELHVAEIQVFGETHAEPPQFPEAVCDPANGDGTLLARVWSPIHDDPHADAYGFRNIELRGDLIWSGAGDAANASVPHATGVMRDGAACINGMDDEIPVFGPRPPVASEYSIWDGIAVGGDAQTFWGLDQSTSTIQGSYNSLDSSTHLGVEFELQVGLGVQAIVGASYEFTMGTTNETQNSVSWGSGLGISGEVGGFEDPAPGVVASCKYKPRPYAFRRQEFSDAGSLQDMYVTDYVVRQGQLGGLWQRGDVAEACYTGEGMVDRIFDDGFDAGTD